MQTSSPQGRIDDCLRLANKRIYSNRNRHRNQNSHGQTPDVDGAATLSGLGRTPLAAELLVPSVYERNVPMQCGTVVSRNTGHCSQD